MCQIIVINKGEKELDTPRKVQDHFGFDLKKHWSYDEIDLDSCLCQLDIEAIFKDNNIAFKYEPHYMSYLVDSDTVT
jgi:hypothetical protein